MLLFLGLSMPDRELLSRSWPSRTTCRSSALVFLLAFFTWLATYRRCKTTSGSRKG